MKDRLSTVIGGLVLPNPIICGSGEHVMTAAGIRAALDAGAAGVIAKSVNETQAAARQLDFADYAVLDQRGEVAEWPGKDPLTCSLLCRSGLAQRDPAEWFREIASIDGEARVRGQFAAASIVLGDERAAAELARLAQSAGIRILELNIGAPHASEAQAGAIAFETDRDRVREVVRYVKGATKLVLWVKLGGLAGDLPALTREARQGGADAVVLAGRFMGLMPDLDTLRPVLGTSGAYGGRWALPITCRWLALSRRAVPHGFPLIGTNGARNGMDVARFILAGAVAVEMTSAVLMSGFGVLTQARGELAAWLDQKDLTVRDVIGRAADALESYGEQTPDPERWRSFAPRETTG